ncbi:MAG: hypothetical protein UHC59_09390 [Fibrobacteraceae bacterium]|nr:hypothetical protein [Fibrobacteraceae bacterium]
MIPQTNGSVIFYVGNDFQWNGTIVANARSCQTANKFLVRELCHYDEMRQRFLSLRDVQNARHGNLLPCGSCHLRWNVVTEAISSQATLVFLITSLRS